jgi:beta-lactamase regulating signal transducer with metallopeptidase domain
MNVLAAWLWQGAAIAIVTTLAVRAVPAAAASKRHVIWCIALVLTLLLPFVDAFATSVTGRLKTVSALANNAGGLTLPLPPTWAMVGALALWGIAAAFYVSRLALGLRRLRQLVSWSLPFDSERAERMPRWCERRSSGRAAEVRVSGDIAGACAIGFWHPTILVSTSLAAALNEEALESIILHEHAHLQRYDDWAGAVQCVLLGLARWHPAVQWISRQIDVEREIASDQYVVARDRTALTYARNLAEAAELIAGAPGRAPRLAPGYSITAPMLRVRVERLLESASVRSRSFAGWKSAAVATAVIAIAVWLSNVPQLITFTASVARVATLASSSFRIGVPQVLPSVLAGRAEIAARSPESVAPAIPAAVATSQPAQIPVEDTMPSSAVPEAVLSVSRPSVPSVSRPVPSVHADQLSSTPIPLLARIPDVESMGGSEAEANGVDWVALGRTSAAAGMAVAKAGTATGLAASRAGTSVSRFFKNGGLAIARSF